MVGSKFQILCCTIKYGLGVDPAGVPLVVFGMPRSSTDLSQEMGIEPAEMLHIQEEHALYMLLESLLQQLRQNIGRNCYMGEYMKKADTGWRYHTLITVGSSV